MANKRKRPSDIFDEPPEARINANDKDFVNRCYEALQTYLNFHVALRVNFNEFVTLCVEDHIASSRLDFYRKYLRNIQCFDVEAGWLTSIKSTLFKDYYED